MTLFEYIAVAVSIVLSLSVAQILNGLRDIFDPRFRDPLHASWVVVLLITHVVAWWDFWGYREVEWSLPAFILVLGVASTVYISTQALVIRDLTTPTYREHFEATRSTFFPFMALLIGASVVRDAMLQPHFNILVRGPELSLTLLCLVGWRVSSRRVHILLNAIVWALLLVTAGFLWADPAGAGPE